MFTCREGGELSSQASKMLYKPPGEVYIAPYKEPLDQSDYWKLFVQLWNYTNINYLSYLDLFAEIRNKAYKVDREIEEIANKGDKQLYLLLLKMLKCSKWNKKQTHIMRTPSDISLISKIFSYVYCKTRIQRTPLLSGRGHQYKAIFLHRQAI